MPGLFKAYGKNDLAKWLRENEYWGAANWLENNGLEIGEDSVSDALMECLYWDDTPQGSDVWSDIHDEMLEEESGKYDEE